MPQSLTEQLSRDQQAAALQKDWDTNPRWKGIKRGYTAAEVVRLRGSFPIEHTLARRGAEKLWGLAAYRGLCQLPGCIDGWTSHAAGQGWGESHLPVGLAGSC